MSKGLLKLFFLLPPFTFLLLTLSACQRTLKTGYVVSPITYSTFTEQSGWQIWQYDTDYDQSRQLTMNENEAYYPTLGPSGLLAYSDHNGKIWLLDLNNQDGEKQPPQAISSLPKYCGHPAISPDGERLTCVCFTFLNRSENSDLYMVDIKTGKSSRLISFTGLQKHPAWSPDGKQIVFSSGYREIGGKIIEQLWLIGLSNKVPVKIIDNGHSNIHPAWSPNGQQIAYSSDVNGSLDIWLYDLLTKRSSPVTNSSVLKSEPSWRPDGNALVYVSTQEGAMAIWEIDLNTKLEQKLLSFPEDIHEPVWYKGE
ncbi:hypothetical protein BMR06_16490 [Methylococcaceae bacterium HT5]|nr:hypothetical protein BMR06_16490 [Methylococcaceae bacterium HT5]